MTEKKDEKEPHWFWKIFGSALIGVICLLLLAHFNNINAHIDRTFLDLKGESKELRISFDLQKEKIIKIESVLERYYLIETKINSLTNLLDFLKEKTTANEQQIADCKENIKRINEEIKAINSFVLEKMSSLSLEKKAQN